MKTGKFFHNRDINSDMSLLKSNPYATFMAQRIILV